MLSVLNDLHQHLDCDQTAALILLDLSAAFDMVDHDIMANRIEAAGVTGTALRWFKSFLQDRAYSVQMGWPVLLTYQDPYLWHPARLFPFPISL